MSRAMHTAVAVDYPYRDGRPMAESDAHLGAMLYLLPVLRTHFAHRPDVYVGGDMFVYYEQGNPEAVVAPDVFVVMGAPAGAGGEGRAAPGRGRRRRTRRGGAAPGADREPAHRPGREARRVCPVEHC